MRGSMTFGALCLSFDYCTFAIAPEKNVIGKRKNFSARRNEKAPTQQKCESPFSPPFAAAAAR